MIAFHLVISVYGFWLPNDPRGSWSDFVGSWELLKFGPATKVNDGRSYAKDPHNYALRRAAKEALKFPPVRFDDAQREAIGAGFAQACADGAYDCYACCVGFDHARLVFTPHAREMTVMAGHLKAAATKVLAARGVHPLRQFIGKRGTPPTPWREGCWKVFIDTPVQLSAAIRYVERHPMKEGLTPQRWSFVGT